MRAVASLVLLAACYGGGYDVVAQTSGGDCYSLDCPVMAGGEVRMFAVFYDDTGEHPEPVRSASISPLELGDLTIDGDAIVMRAAGIAGGTQPLAGDGLGVLHVEMANGEVLDRDFTVVPRASLSIVASWSAVPLTLFPERKLPGERLAMFAGSTFEVHAEHRSADGRQLLGHDDSTWSATNLQLAGTADEDPIIDTSLLQLVRGTEVGPGAIAFGTATFPVDVVTDHSTARIEAASATKPGAQQDLQLYAGEYMSLSVLAYADDGRFIFGGPPFIPMTVTSSDPAVAGIESGSSVGRTFSVHGYRSGTATLTISFDGQSITLPVTVD